MTPDEFKASSLPYDLKFILNLNEPNSNVWTYCNYQSNGFPIVRPLTDLVNEIEHNGKKFVPALELVKLKEKYGKWKDIAPSIDYLYYIVNKPFGKVLKVTKIDTWVIYLSFTEIERSEFFIVQKLLEWHFDVAGLIDNNLGVDVNTLNINPYK